MNGYNSTVNRLQPGVVEPAAEPQQASVVKVITPKRAAVMEALTERELGRCSDPLAEHLGVSATFMGSVRRSLVTAGVYRYPK